MNTPRPFVDSAADDDLLSQDLLNALVLKSRRSVVPVRRSFVQQREEGSLQPGQLAGFVSNRDHRGLVLYLLTLTLASADPWSVQLPADAWTRCLRWGSTPSAMSALSKAWRRLEERKLIHRQRDARRVSVTLLREDGSEQTYLPPFLRNEPYFTLPIAFWLSSDRWFLQLQLPEVAMLLIARSLPNDFILPYEKAKSWYGLSADTAERGLRGLQRRNLLEFRTEEWPTKNVPHGYKEQRRYILKAPFGPQEWLPEASR